MKSLSIPAALADEFATVAAIWTTNAPTRRVDALLLCWVKYEKQLRRLFCFLVFQHPRINENSLQSMLAVLVENKDLNPGTFEKAIKALKVCTVEELLGASYHILRPDMRKIRGYRNKLVHGQVTGEKVNSYDLERHVGTLIKWVAALAAGAEAKFGYDGFGRNTYRAAKASAKVAITDYPFQNAAEFKTWLLDLTR